MGEYTPKRREDEEQATVIAWASLQAAAWPALRNLYHVPNEGKRGRAAAGMAKAAGLRSGVPDLVLDFPAGAYHGLRIEMKVHPNRPTAAQQDWLHRLQDAGYLAAVCYSADARKKQADSWAMIRKPKTRGGLQKVLHNIGCRGLIRTTS